MSRAVLALVAVAGCGGAAPPTALTESASAAVEPAASADVAPALVAEVTESAIVVGDRVLGSGIDWQAGTPEPFDALHRLGDEVDAHPGRVELRIRDAVPGYFLWLLASEVPRVWRRAGYARRIGGQWRRVQGAPPEREPGFLVEVDAREIYLSFDGTRLRTLRAPPGGHDLIELSVALRELRGGRLRAHTDARIVSTGGTFGDLARTLEAARDAGFADAFLDGNRPGD